MNTGTAAVATTNDGQGTGLGFTFTKMTIEATPKCRTHYMMVQTGLIPAGTANAGAIQKFSYGVKDFASTFDALTAPTAATAP